MQREADDVAIQIGIYSTVGFRSADHRSRSKPPRLQHMGVTHSAKL